MFRASRDGKTSEAFHRICDGIEKTLIIAYVADLNIILGGYCGKP